jgi:hypothetical protein
VTSTPLKSNLRQWFSGRDFKLILLRAAIALVAAFLLTISGPFGTLQAGNAVERFIYWGIVLAVSIPLGCVLKWFVLRLLSGQGILLQEGFTIVLVTGIFTPFLWLWTLWSFEGFAKNPMPMIWMAQIVLIISVAISSLMYVAPFMLESSNPEEDISPSPARILRRLPDGFSGRILHLAIEDHIVQVVTNAGTFSLRMRFSDAVDEVSEIKGCCTHRSHWVVFAEIESIDWVNGRPFLLMSSGRTVPVSRKYQPDLERQGIL